MKRKKRTSKKARQSQLQHDTEEDRLSSLPDSLLVSILSLLSVKQAAATSVLSHRWTHLWTRITRLDLRYSPSRINYNEEGQFPYISTVVRIFEQLTSKKIHSLHLGIPFLHGSHVNPFHSALEKWLGRVCGHNIEDIKLSGLSWLPNSRLPTSPFICRSLIALELTGGSCSKLPDVGIISLPNLNKLVLHSLRDWDCQTMFKLFSSCPVLEVLDLYIYPGKQGHYTMDISFQNLRSLKIDVQGTSQGWNYIINAPKLEMFDMNGLVSSFRFVENPCLLTEAKIKWEKCKDASVDTPLDQISGLVQGISSVVCLELTSIPLYPLVHLDENILPTFHNLSKLHICFNDTCVTKNPLRFLHCTPNLEVLFIYKFVCEKGVKFDVPDSVPLSLFQKIKKIKVTCFEGNNQELMLLTYILGNASVLKSVVVGVSSKSTIQVGKEARFCQSVFWCPRISKDCVIEFQGTYVRALSTDDNPNATLKCEIQGLYRL